MTWLSDRQSVLAENVANADTPGFVGQDLRPPDFRQILQQSTSQVALTTTNPAHITAKRTLADIETRESESGGSGPGGHVSLEQEMLKVSQTANDYALVATLYRANLGLVKTVLGRSS
ncbi:MAG TPA: flagellar basal body protein [Stellaceae bacterium]|nr:flagellar basal body protein [Stellaceae bacterium]